MQVALRLMVALVAVPGKGTFQATAEAVVVGGYGQVVMQRMKPRQRHRKASLDMSAQHTSSNGLTCTQPPQVSRV